MAAGSHSRRAVPDDPSTASPTPTKQNVTPNAWEKKKLAESDPTPNCQAASQTARAIGAPINDRLGEQMRTSQTMANTCATMMPTAVHHIAVMGVVPLAIAVIAAMRWTPMG